MLPRTKIGGRMTRDYFLALGMIGVLVFGSYVAIDQMVRRQMAIARLVELSAAQSVFSQRIPMLAQRLADARDPAAARALHDDLTQARDTFWDAHLALTGGVGTPATPVPAHLAQIYFGGPHRLDHQARAFVAAADAVLAGGPQAPRPAEVETLVHLAQGPLIASLGAAMLAHRDAADARMRVLRQTHGAIAIGTLGLLGLVAIAIFAPMVRRTERMTDALIAARREMEHSALHDSLTGLPNRRYLDDFLARALANARRNGHTVGILHLDLDRFKEVNDNFGHKAGDAVLQATARIMLASVRTSDFVARIGGDEFIIVSPEQRQPDGLSILAQRLIDRLSEPMPYEAVMTEVNASIGIALATPESGMDAERLMIAADIALYQAKHSGRAQYRVYTPVEAPLGAAQPQLTLITGGARG